MTEAILWYDYDQFEPVLDALMRLPEPFKPVGFGYDADETAKNRVDDTRRFEAFLAKSQSGFSLYAERIQYSFNITAHKEFYVYALDMDTSQALRLVRELSRWSARFAYAADNDEYLHRNRLVKKASYGTVEAWVGRDWRRYVPGLYWLTVISEELAQQHGVPLEALKDAALRVEETASGTWLLRFFEKPDQWLAYVGQLDRLCEETPGLFAISRARPTFEQASTFLETTEALHVWP